jgi:hypothetical protein
MQKKRFSTVPSKTSTNDLTPYTLPLISESSLVPLRCLVRFQCHCSNSKLITDRGVASWTHEQNHFTRGGANRTKPLNEGGGLSNKRTQWIQWTNWKILITNKLTTYFLRQKIIPSNTESVCLAICCPIKKFIATDVVTIGSLSAFQVLQTFRGNFLFVNQCAVFPFRENEVASPLRSFICARVCLFLILDFTVSTSGRTRSTSQYSTHYKRGFQSIIIAASVR